MSEENKPLNEKLTIALKIFEGITEATKPPQDLEPEKRGMLVCLTIGTIGNAALAYVKVPWWGFASQVVLVVVMAILIGYRRKK